MMLLDVNDVWKRFPVRGGVWRRPVAFVQAVNGVSFQIAAGETLGIVGESGCGKSTLARLLVHLLRPDAGTIHFAGTNLGQLRGARLRAVRREIQMIFQDPVSSLNPRMTIGDILAEPFHIHHLGTRRDRTRQVAELLELVGLAPAMAMRYPHEFSGGQRQRIGIARAIALRPKLVICDEPVSALDVSVQGEILNLLLDLQAQLGLAYLFIAHDMKVVAQVSHRIAVMYLGRIVETMPAADLARACHPYTRALLAAVPQPDPARAGSLQPIVGDVPSPISPPTGCAFHPRCPHAEPPRCQHEPPVLEAKPGGHHAACHFAERVQQLTFRGAQGKGDACDQ